MITAKATIRGVAPFQYSRYHNTDKLAKETAKDYEARTWRERAHVDENGNLFIPPMAFKNCLAEAAKYLSKQIPGKGKATYTKHFEAGVLVTEPMVLATKKADAEPLWLFVPADGKRGGSTRVEKCFPIVRQWGGEITFYILDPTITEDVFREHLTEAGKFIGVGAFRPRNNGYFGRFDVTNVDWAES